MASVSILDYEVNCAQGNLEETIIAIRDENIKIATKTIEINKQEIDIPFYALKDEINQNQDVIYKALRDVVHNLVSKLDKQKRLNTAVIIGTSLVDWNLVDAINASAYEYKKQPYNSQKRSIDSYAKDLSNEFGLNEFTMSINTACTSSANALLEAKNLINAGVVQYAIVVGLEIFSPVMSSGFYSMELLSSTYLKPFDLGRGGLVLGESIACMLLGNEDSPWSLVGGFSNCNSQTITSVSPSGQECIEVMQKALDDCSLHVEEITALKAHATGSLSNDEAEMNAINKMFDSSLVFTALKPYVGHTIGASGVLEIAIMISAIDKGFLPKTIFCEDSMSANFIPLKEHKNCNSGTFMCNYFGFGGNNTSLIIKKESL